MTVLTTRPVGAGTKAPAVGLVYLGASDFQPLSTSLNLWSSYSNALILKVGDLLSIIPIHSCLTADKMGEYFCDNKKISMMKT